MQCWSQSAVDTLKNCLDITDWSVFNNDSNDINTFTHVVCSYMNFCIEQCIPTKIVTIYQNNKNWFNLKIKEKIKKKDEACGIGKV